MDNNIPCNSCSLPRSVRWRLQLGLLGLPPPNDESDNSTTDSAASSFFTLQDLNECNAGLLDNQRKRYQDLVENKHKKALHHAALLREPTSSPEQPASSSAEAAAPEKGVPALSSSSSKQSIPAKEKEETTTVSQLDPLTAMLRQQEAQEKRRQELELKYRKERARRNRGINHHEQRSTGGDSSQHSLDSSHAYLDVIDKDLHRLQPDHFTYHHSRKRLLLQQQQQQHKAGDDVDNRKDNDASFDTSVKERTARLAELLLIHAREHAVLGYRQGMHEIASYLLLVLEMDLYDIESAEAASSGRTAATTTTTAIVDDENEAISGLMDATYLVHDAYVMFERVMESLSPAYDVKQSSPNAQSSLSPMEEMGRSVVSQLKTVVCDQALYDVVKAMHCPPELYCTRWVRLMFSREVLGWRNVLLLWDVFFDLITCHGDITSMDSSKYSKPGKLPRLQLGRFTLMQVLESTAASMILLQRETLLEADSNESIQVLMNVPPLKNVLPLTATLLSLARRLQIGPDYQSSTASIASLSASFGQMARGAFQQIAPTAGESFRKLYDSTASYGLSVAPSTPTRQDAASSSSLTHPLSAVQETNQESSVAARSPEDATNARPSLDEDGSRAFCLNLAGTLEKSGMTLTEYLMKVNEGGRVADEIPQEIWEALAQIETVRKELLRHSKIASSKER